MVHNDDSPDGAAHRLSHVVRLGVGFVLVLIAIVIAIAADEGMEIAVLRYNVSIEFWRIFAFPTLALGLSLLLTSFEPFDAVITGPTKILGIELGGGFKGISLLFVILTIGLFFAYFKLMKPLSDERAELDAQRKNLEKNLSNLDEASLLHEKLRNRFKQENILNELLTTYLNGDMKMKVQFTCPGEEAKRKMYWTTPYGDQLMYLSLEPESRENSSQTEAKVGLAAPFTVKGEDPLRTVELYPDSSHKDMAMKLTFSLKEDGVTASITAGNLLALVEKCDALRREEGSPEVKTANAEADKQKVTTPPEAN